MFTRTAMHLILIHSKAFHPHIAPVLRMNLGFSAFLPHIAPVLRMNLGFSAFHPHIAPVLRMNWDFLPFFLIYGRLCQGDSDFL